MTPEQSKDAAAHLVGASPSLAAIIVWLGNIPIEKWVAMLGGLLILVQMAHWVWRFRRDVRHERERVMRGLPPPETGPGAL